MLFHYNYLCYHYYLDPDHNDYVQDDYFYVSDQHNIVSDDDNHSGSEHHHYGPDNHHDGCPLDLNHRYHHYSRAINFHHRGTCHCRAARPGRVHAAPSIRVALFQQRPR
jgi:hypothetical protein